jgi:hypothetical protein
MASRRRGPGHRKTGRKAKPIFLGGLRPVLLMFQYFGQRTRCAHARAHATYCPLSPFAARIASLSSTSLRCRVACRLSPQQEQGLGMRIVARLAKQLEAGVSHRGDGGGTEFVLMVPLICPIRYLFELYRPG